MEKLYKDSETGCCPRFDPKPWDKKQVTWKDKLFLKDHVRSFFHIPLNFGSVMKKNKQVSMLRDSAKSSSYKIGLVHEQLTEQINEFLTEKLSSNLH
jgi:hypothetical protein